MKMKSASGSSGKFADIARIFRCFVLPLGIALVSASMTEAVQKQGASLLDDGVELLGKGRFLDALAVLSRFKQSAPEDPRPYFYSGMALVEAGRLSAAALESSEAVRLDPRKPEYRIFHANVLVGLRQREAALDALALLDKPEGAKQLEAAWLWLLADVYSRLDRTEAALKILDQIAARNPSDTRVNLKRGQILLAKGEIDLAEESIRKRIRNSPEDAVAQFEMGKILHQRNEIAAAKKALLSAVAQDSENPEYLHRLGLVCLALNDVDEAILYLERAEPSANLFPQVYYALGSAYQRKGDRERAWKLRKKYQETSEASRSGEDRDREVGRLIREGERLLDQGKTAEARLSFERVLELDPGSWDAHGYLAEILLAADDWRRSLPHLVRMEEIDPESAVGSYLMARYCNRAGELEKALAYASKVKSIRPGHAELRNLLGHIYAGLGQPDNALREYEEAVRLAPQRADFRADLAKLKARKTP